MKYLKAYHAPLDITEGARVYDYNHLLTGDVEIYAHDGGVFVLYSHEKRKHVSLDPIGMTPGEIERAVTVCNTLLAREDPAPANRHERRAGSRLH